MPPDEPHIPMARGGGNNQEKSHKKGGERRKKSLPPSKCANRGRPYMRGGGKKTV